MPSPEAVAAIADALFKCGLPTDGVEHPRTLTSLGVAANAPEPLAALPVIISDHRGTILGGQVVARRVIPDGICLAYFHSSLTDAAAWLSRAAVSDATCLDDALASVVSSWQVMLGQEQEDGDE